jgi:Protein of unknown function (DUF2523)
MIRFLFRCIGIVLLALAFIFVIYDGMKSIASHAFYATRIEQFWTEVHSRSLQMFRESLERDGWAGLWRWVIEPFLDQPIAVVFALLSVLLIFLGRKKKPLIGYVRE